MRSFSSTERRIGAPLSGSTKQYSWVGMQSSSSTPVSKKREPSKAISLRLDTSLVPGSGPSRLRAVVVRRLRGEGEKAEQLELCSSVILVAAQRARIIDDFVAADIISIVLRLCSYSIQHSTPFPDLNAWSAKRAMHGRRWSRCPRECKKLLKMLRT